MSSPSIDHPHTDPGDGRTECGECGKFVWPVMHSCKGIPVTEVAKRRASDTDSKSGKVSTNPPRTPTQPPGRNTTTSQNTLPETNSQTGPAVGHFCDQHFSWLCQAGQGECQRAEIEGPDEPADSAPIGADHNPHIPADELNDVREHANQLPDVAGSVPELRRLLLEALDDLEGAYARMDVANGRLSGDNRPSSSVGGEPDA